EGAEAHAVSVATARVAVKTVERVMGRVRRTRRRYLSRLCAGCAPAHRRRIVTESPRWLVQRYYPTAVTSAMSSSGTSVGNPVGASWKPSVAGMIATIREFGVAQVSA